MRRRFLTRMSFSAGAFCAGVALSGCAMGDHSNTLLFGTNTNFGLLVGRDASNVASINVGYRRQEAVYLPLLANLKNGNGEFVPCPGSASATPPLMNDCKFLAKNGQSTAEDGYSVLASFGAEFNTSNSSTGIGAGGGLAQYFATGTAAQILALKGGAAAVAVGTAAAASAAQPSGPALAALVGAQDVSATLNVLATQRTEFANHLQMGSDADYQREADAISGRTDFGMDFLRGSFCATLSRSDCIAKIRSPEFNEFISEFFQAWKMSP